MRAVRTITVVGCHAGGEIGNVVVGGVLPPPGATVFDQMRHLQQHGDGLRKLLLREPRGSVACHANLVVPARSRADAGFIIMEPTEYPPMSGSNTICTARCCWRRAVQMREPETVLRLEAPGEWSRCAPPADGLRERRVQQRAVLCRPPGRAAGGGWAGHARRRRRLRLRVDANARVYVAELGGVAIEPSEARELSLAGERIRAAAREQLPCTHPENPEISGVSIVQIAEPWRGVGEVSRNAVVVSPGRLDRSATGTGLSARMAALHARGQMRVGDTMSHASAIGSVFEGRIVSETTVADRPAIVPAIRAAPGSPASRS
jgi:proline racemase